MTLKEANYILKQIDDSPLPGHLISQRGKSILRGIVADACMVQCLQEEEEENLYAKASV
jgi:hypothetical protein